MSGSKIFQNNTTSISFKISGTSISWGKIVEIQNMKRKYFLYMGNIFHLLTSLSDDTLKFIFDMKCIDTKSRTKYIYTVYIIYPLSFFIATHEPSESD